ncbi:MAG: cytochrome-c oxidase, cbb3-type subunit III [Alphaproteobacteria bacterium]|nr:cytochrome-c oxidase, cbb3-type subunit III [Alphaproteobacteria bacterium]
MPTKIEKDAVSGTMTTGHEWDGVKELNTPLPSWWVYTFYATIAWAAVIMLLYPSVPALSGYWKGLIGYSAREEVMQDMATARQARAATFQRIETASLADIRRNPELFTVALAGGKAAFGENCAACHGAGGQGAKGGFPSLADDTWLWGGSLSDIQQTIQYGIRNTHAESRQSAMPKFGIDGVLTNAQISDVAEFVLSLSRRSTDAASATRGAAVFAENCVSCHQENGTGNRELGAPNLTTGIWLYGGDKASIMETVRASRSGNMPAWVERLDPMTIKMLAVYVHALGGGE